MANSHSPTLNCPLDSNPTGVGVRRGHYFASGTKFRGLLPAFFPMTHEVLVFRPKVQKHKAHSIRLVISKSPLRRRPLLQGRGQCHRATTIARGMCVLNHVALNDLADLATSQAT